MAQNNIYLSGHINFSQLKDLDKNYIFTFLRDLKERLFSLFFYDVTHVFNGVALKNDPSLARFENFSFADFIILQSPNRMSKKLIANAPGMSFKGVRCSDDFYKFVDVVRASIERCGDIFGRGPQDVVDHLSDLGFMGHFELPHKNKSEFDVALEVGMSEDHFMSVMRKYTWLDYLVAELCSEIFDRYNPSLLSDSEFLDKLKKRYNVVFGEKCHV